MTGYFHFGNNYFNSAVSDRRIRNPQNEIYIYTDRLSQIPELKSTPQNLNCFKRCADLLIILLKQIMLPEHNVPRACKPDNNHPNIPSTLSSIPRSAGSHFTDLNVSRVSQAASSCSFRCIESDSREHAKQCMVR